MRDGAGTITVAASGNRLAHVDPFGETCLYVSRDCGASWVKSVVNASAGTGDFVDYRDTGLLDLGNGQMVLTYFTHNSQLYANGPEPLWTEWKDAVNQADLRNADAILARWREKPWFSGSYLRWSNDAGKSWSKPQMTAVSSPHGPTLMRDGRLLYVGRCGGGVGIIFGTPVRDEAGKLTDLTWTEPQMIAESADFGGGQESVLLCEPHGIELESGRLLIAIRAQNRIGGRQSDSPCCHTGFATLIRYSDDGGRTWCEPDGIRIAGSPPHLTEIDPGVVLLTFSERWNSAPDYPAWCGEAVRVSRDGGLTWSGEMVINRGPNGDCGYPSTVLLGKEGDRYRFLTVYYQNDGRTTDLLGTTWTLTL